MKFKKIVLLISVFPFFANSIELNTLLLDSSGSPITSSASSSIDGAGSLDGVVNTVSGGIKSFYGDSSGIGLSVDGISGGSLEISSGASTGVTGGLSSLNPSGIPSSSIPNSSSGVIASTGIIPSLGGLISGSGQGSIEGSLNASSLNVGALVESSAGSFTGGLTSLTSVPNSLNTSLQKNSSVGLGSLTGSAGSIDGSTLGNSAVILGSIFGAIGYLFGKNKTDVGPVVPPVAGCQGQGCLDKANINLPPPPVNRTGFF